MKNKINPKNQRRKAKTLKIIVWLIIILFCLNSALALGIRPVKTEIDLQPTYQGSFKVVNNDHKDMKVKIYVQGDLKDYIELSQTELELSSSEELKEIKFKLELPEKQLIPGIAEGLIIVEEELYSRDKGGSFVTANLKIAHKVRVNVPTPENFITVDIDIDEFEKGVDLITNVKNLGTADLERVKPIVEVFSGEEKISSYEHPAKRLDSKEEFSFKNYVEKEKLGKGEFKVLSAVSYAEYTLEIIESFMIGEPIIKIINYDKYFVENEINELAIELKSEWNTLIDNIHAQVLVFKNGKEVFSTKTTSFDLAPYEEKKITAHFDTRNLELGDYDINLVLNYRNYSIVEKYEAHILSERAYNRRQSPDSLMYILIAVVIVAIAIIALLSYTLLNKKRK